MVIRPETLTTHIPAATVLTDRECMTCGYVLKGLKVDGVCPECATPIRMPSNIDAPLAEMPHHVIRTLRAGCFICAATSILYIVAQISSAFGGLLPAAAVSINLTLAVAWFVGVWLATPAFDLPAAAFRGFGPRGRLRHAARWLQLGWVVAALAHLIAVLLPTPPGGATTVQRMLETTVPAGATIVGLVGLGVAIVLLQRIAEWVREDSAERALNLALWGVPTLTILGMIDIPIARVWLVAIVLGLFWIVAVGAFPYGLVLLARSISLAVFHAEEHEEREARRAERRRTAAEKAAQRVAEIDRANAEQDGAERR